MKASTTLMLLILFCSCNNKISKSNKLDQFQWLIGSWQNISNEGSLYEIWTKKNDSTFTGNGFLIVNNDTVFSEKIALQLNGSDLFYVPTVTNQNNDEPVAFKLTSDKNGEFIFENMQHDFPQIIIYSNPKPDSLHAKIEGYDKGKFRKEEFFMARMK